jgi:RNA polymerase sigma-70 factor (ECF subfamily)
MATESDASIISRSLEQPDCFEVLFDRHFSRLLSYLARRVGRDLGAELAADTFERAFRSRARFVDVEGSALPWLYGIAGNVLRMHWRAEERRLRAFARQARLQTDGSGEDPSAGMAAVDPALVEAVAALSRPLREVLLLHAWGELSNDEIAAAIGLPPATVRTRLHRARAQVARRLGLADWQHELRTETV